MNKKTYNLYSLGCKVNQYDSVKLATRLEGLGLLKVEKMSTFAVVYTCSVTGAAVRKNKSMINKAKLENPEAKIILAGCWPRVEDFDASDYSIDLILKDEDETALLALIFGNGEIVDIKGHASKAIVQSRARYFIKVQDGCEQFCSYCVIPYARGKLRSRAASEVLAEITDAIDAGFKEFILSGIHLGLYGYNTDYKLINLLKDILTLKGLGRVRLSSIEVREVTDDIINLIATSDKMCKHLHIPLQSGCDKTLEAMNRPYLTDVFRKKIKDIRKKVPDIAISTDVIVGFPGETDADFETTRAFIEEIKFSRLHVFSFSAHKKTPAYSMPDHVNGRVARKRSKTLRVLDISLEQSFKERFKGQKLKMILENKVKGRSRLKSEYFFDVNRPSKDFERVDIGAMVEIDY